MATQNFHNMEGQSTHRPPLFNGVDYNYWKVRMRVYLQSIDYALWRIVEDGPFVPTKSDKDKLIPKDPSEFDEDDERKLSINARAMNILYCALDRNEFNRITSCKSAQAIWHTLEVIHEGTNQVKETKINHLIRSYEMFEMKDDESITSMYTRFTDIVNGLTSLDRPFKENELVNKIVRSLPKSWNVKRTTLEEMKNLSTISLDDLIGSLMTHEFSRIKDNQEEDKKKKGIALKASTQEEVNEHEEEEDLDQLDKEMISLFTKKYKRFYNKFSQGKSSRRNEEKGDKMKRDEIICYDCKKPGHKRTECPLKRSYKKSSKRDELKKVLQATWDELELGESDDDEQGEVANMCFMAIDDNEVTSNSKLHIEENSITSLSYEDIELEFSELHEEYSKLAHRNASHRKTIEQLKEEITLLTNEKNNALCENVSLKEKIDDLTKIVLKFTNGKKNFDQMLGGQRCVFNKGGLGYKPHVKQKYFKNYFVKASTSDPKYVCTYCNQNGHTSFSCAIKKNTYFETNQGSRTNHQGPKFIWVPKIKT